LVKAEITNDPGILKSSEELCLTVASSPDSVPSSTAGRHADYLDTPDHFSSSGCLWSFLVDMSNRTLINKKEGI
jgi:hypothetical protein